ncbi:MAG: hypothetical protein ACRD4E_01675 [Bryobacteraceae bacterium]
MNDSVFIHFEFWLLLLFSIALPFAIYSTLMSVRRISRFNILLFAFALIVLSGLDVFLLNHLANAAHRTDSLLDDKIFASEFSLALYLLPLLTAGLGINLLSDLLLAHLRRVMHIAETRVALPPPDEQSS